LVLHLFEKKPSLEILKKVGTAIVGFGIISAPLILFDLKNHFLNTANLIKTLTKGEILSDKSLQKSVIDRMSDTITAFINHVLNTQLTPHFAVLIFIIFAVASIWLFLKVKQPLLRLHILNVLLFILAFGVLNSARHMHYYGSVYYSVYLVVAYMLYLATQHKALRFTVVPLMVIIYIALNSPNYYFLYKDPNNKINDAKKIAESIVPHVKKTPYQIVALPTTITDGHIRYFLEISKFAPLNYDTAEQGEELYVLCFYGETCKIIGNAQWQIAAFENAKIDTMWKLDLVTIYKLVHEKK
ncbi:MAG: hypothetical protein ABIO02_02800, partial [Patescibacteria group bacterium]